MSPRSHDAQPPGGGLGAGASRHRSGHAHPGAAGSPTVETGATPRIGIVGAGAVGTALAVAFSRAGWPIAAVASRDPDRRARFVRLVGGGPLAVATAAELLDAVDLLVLAVPDDAIAGVAGSIRLYGGQSIVHTSGLLGAEVLAPALAAGAHAGAFHPLVSFAETERAVAALRGATVALEGDARLLDLLAALAEAIGAIPVRLAPGAKAAYHAAAVLAAGGFVALLDAIAELGRVAGLDEAATLAVYGPLIEGTLGNARALGIRAALTGPATRGDAGTLDAHLAELRRRAPGVLPLYAAAAEREIDLARERGAIDEETADRLRDHVAAALAKPV